MNQSIEVGDIHVWYRSLDGVGVSESDLERLSADERRRATRMKSRAARSDFVLARSTLRQLLGESLGLSPEGIEFAYHASGKPYLADRALSEWHFNVSHSSGRLLVAVSRGRPIGVDIERIRPGVPALALARRFFAPQEYDALQALVPSERVQAFFRVWTRKEAFVKALGRGISMGLHRFAVGVHPEATPSVEPLFSEAEGVVGSLHDLPVEPGFAAALYVLGEGGTIRFRTYPTPLATR